MIAAFFSDRQKKIIATALTSISLVVVIAVTVICFSMVLRFLSYFSGVFLPLAVAAILATLLKPYYEWLVSRLHSPAAAIVVLFLTFLIPVAVLLMYFGSLLLSQLSSFLAELPLWLERAQLFIEERLPAIKGFLQQYDIKARLARLFHEKNDALTQSVAFLGQGIVSTGSVVFGAVSSLLAWFVMPIYFIFILQAPLLTRESLECQLPFLKPQTRANAVYLITEFATIVVAFFRGQFVIALSQGILYAAGFAFLGLPHGVVLGILLGLLNMVPYLGNIIGLAVVLPLAWFYPGGGLALLAGAIIVFVVVQVIESYILTPRIMGKTTGLHPMVIVLAILFWGTALNSLLGMILAIPLTAFLVVFWRLMKSTYIREWI